MEEWFII
jgi:hypothetical protein